VQWWVAANEWHGAESNGLLWVVVGCFTALCLPHQHFCTALTTNVSLHCLAECAVGWGVLPDAATCSRCPAGQASAGGINTVCAPCEQGQLSTQPGSAACSTCPSGSSNSGTGNTRCNGGCCAPTRSWLLHDMCGTRRAPSACCMAPNLAGRGACPAGCSPGYGISPTAATCTICPAGQASAGGVDATCEPSPEGQYTSQPGAASFSACPAGSSNNGTGNAGCTCEWQPAMCFHCWCALLIRNRTVLHTHQLLGCLTMQSQGAAEVMAWPPRLPSFAPFAQLERGLQQERVPHVLPVRLVATARKALAHAAAASLGRSAACRRALALPVLGALTVLHLQASAQPAQPAAQMWVKGTTDATVSRWCGADAAIGIP
jgi:hypothetical protein